MADVLEMLMGLLCQRDTLYQCQSFVQEFPDPATQAIYFFFFPTVFVILFIYVLSDKVATTINPKFKVLIGIALFVFIVLQGWYYFLLTLSRFWYVSVIVLGGFYTFMNMGIKREGGDKSGSATQKAIGSVTDFMKKRAMTGIRGDEKSLNDRIKMQEDRVVQMEKTIDGYEKVGSRDPDAKVAAAEMRRMKMMTMQEIEVLVGQLKDITSFEGTDIGKSSHIGKHKKWLQDHSKN